MRTRSIAALLALAVVSAACSSGGPAPSTGPTTPGSTPVGGGGGATPTPVGGGGGTSNACDAFPVYNPASPGPAPTFAQDTELLAKFPATIDGEPIENPQVFPYLAYLCYFGRPGVDATAQALARIGIDLATVSVGSFDAVVGFRLSVAAYRVPGADANALFQNLAVILAALGEDPDPTPLTTATVAGKTVYFRADGSGFNGDGEEYRDYFYPSGDTLWSSSAIVESQANKVFPALP